MRNYTIEWDYKGRYWIDHRTRTIAHRTHTLSAYNIKDARERFNDWYEVHGALDASGDLRHPFHITIHRAQEAEG